MEQRGFTFVELVVVLVIMITIIAIAAIDFQSWSRKNSRESMIRQLYSDLQGARNDALLTKRINTVTLSPSQYVITNYSSASDPNGAVTQVKQLAAPITWSGGSTISFDSTGFANTS